MVMDCEIKTYYVAWGSLYLIMQDGSILGKSSVYSITEGHYVLLGFTALESLRAAFLSWLIHKINLFP